MVILKRINKESALNLRDVRLRALQDTPSAFGSTYARESRWSVADWEERAAKGNGDRSATYLAWDGDEACGIAACFLDPDDHKMAHLVSMWVAPTHRRHGVGRLLVNRIIEWSRTRSAETLRLNVTSNNDVAIRFYERLGFAMTGNTQPDLNDPDLVELEMIRPNGRDG
jgi:ribosomal protein S18 acetylase RimI-like enzyme